jgi:hypothetical protein
MNSKTLNENTPWSTRDLQVDKRFQHTLKNIAAHVGVSESAALTSLCRYMETSFTFEVLCEIVYADVYLGPPLSYRENSAEPLSNS